MSNDIYNFDDPASQEARRKALEQLAVDPDLDRQALLELSGQGSAAVETPESQALLPSKSESFLRGGAEGATLGWGDEASAALGALAPTATDEEAGRDYGDRYANIRDYLRKQNKEAQIANPKSYMGGQITGGLTTAAALPFATSSVPAIAGSIAGYGALAGAGGAEGQAPLEDDKKAINQLKKEGSVIGEQYPTELESKLSRAYEGAKGAITAPYELAKEAGKQLREDSPFKAASLASLAGLSVLPLTAKNKGLYSKAGQIVEQKMGAKATPEQITGLLREAKPEELEFMKLKEFLGGKQKIGKEELLSHIQESQPQLKTIIHSEKAQNEALNKVDSTNWTAQNVALDQHKPKFDDYVLAGPKENYQENLITLPNKSGLSPEEESRFKILLSKAEESDGADLSPSELVELDKYQKGPIEKGNYSSPHWSEPNVLLHTRTTDRVDTEGNKVLMLEELQSDWHQAGRKLGYKQPHDTISATFKDAQEYYGIPEDRWNILSENDKHSYFTEMIEDPRYKSSYSPGVVDAPFKKTWPELGLKKTLLDAAQKDYNKIAWTTGEQQAEHYNLSKIYGGIEYSPSQQKLALYKKDGRTVDRYIDNVTDQNLDKYVGKDMANKVINKPEQPGLALGGKTKTVYGEDLKIGGEGMKGFYDQMLPTIANKLMKKFGGKVETSEISIGRDIAGPSKYTGPELTSKQLRIIANKQDVRVAEQLNDIADRIDLAYQFSGIIGENSFKFKEYMAHFGSPASAEAIGGHLELSPLRTAIVHSIKLTPEIKARILKEGFPLFAAGGLMLAGQQDEEE